MLTLTPEQHRRVCEIDQVIDSDNAAPRCGCPAEPWPVMILRQIEWPASILVAACFGCEATWEWGEVCARPTKEES